jgi:hypothetical protein
MAISNAFAAGTRVASLPADEAAETLSQRNIASLDVALTAGDLTAREGVSRIEPGFPRDFAAIEFAHGDTFPLVDDHR